MLRATKHYMKRVKERNISDDNIAAALCGIKISHHDGFEKKYIDRKSRTYIVVSGNSLVTAMKLKPKQMRVMIERSKYKSYIDFSRSIEKEEFAKKRKVNRYGKFSWQTYVFE